MGLCKCPKRKVTTQFCYEHRVNVCEYCVVLNHPRCVVKSYLLWLQDSDYCPKCAFCQNDLILAECVRLSCFHLYHWHCLDQHVREMPATTAPAGYKCIQCNESIIPNSVNASPVVDALRDKLATVNWGRIGLGLPLRAEEEILALKQKSLNEKHLLSSLAFEDPIEAINSTVTNSNDDVIVHIEETSQPRPEESAQIPRRNPGSEKTSNEKTMLIDEDENKYKRRNDPEFLITYGANLWYKLFDYKSVYKRDVFGWKKTCSFTFLLIIFIIMLKIISVYLTGEDSNFDVYANPNVRVKND